MASFGETLARLEQRDGRWRFDVPDEWSQGRTLYGGMTAAVAWTAVTRAHADPGPLRSAQFAFIGPAAGTLAIQPEILRRGRSSAVIAADCRTDEGVAARATFVFGAARASVIAHDLTPRPEVPPPDACEPFHRTSRDLPGFLARFDYRLAAGTRPFSPAGRPEFAVWARLRDGTGDDPVAALLAFADALPCAAMAGFPKPAPISTMTWQIDLHQPLPSHDEWHLLWSSAEATADGYSMQAMRVYNERGAPLATGRQLVAIFI